MSSSAADLPVPSVPPEQAAEQPGEQADLAQFGYRQDLRRRVGSFASFAAGFSFVSILTTVFQLFFLGFGFGGAAFFWTWPVVFAGQLLVALCFATLAARFPISGAIFQWSSRLAGQTFGWFTGWIMIIGQILTVAAAAIALQAVLPAIWSGFQFIGGTGADSSPTSTTGAANAVVLGVILLIITTTINILGVRLMSVVNSTGVVLEILGVAAIVITLFFHVKRGPAVLLTTTGATPTPGSPYIWAWLASGLMAAYVMVGFDSAGELSEETHAPRRITPRTIIRALAVSGVGGLLLILAALLAAPSLTDGNLATLGLPWVLTSIMGPVAGRILLVDVTIAICVCTLACQTSGSRMMFSMARERALPFHRTLGRVSPRTGTPVVTSIVVGAGAALALVVNLGQAAVFTALASLCIAMLYLAYLGVTGPLLVTLIQQARHRITPPGQLDETGKPLFSLGRWAIPVAAAAVIYQVLAFINLAWPRQSVYDLTGHTWWLQWSAVLFIGLSLAVGFAVHQRLRGNFSLIPQARFHARPAELAASEADLA
jgi:urea carboxylase system permease